MGDTRGSYDRIATSYKDQFERELDEKPFDREFLNRAAREFPPGSGVIDLGCGPGHIGRYLAGRRLRVIGIDVSSGMLRQAALDTGGGVCIQADMRALPVRDASVGGVVAFYSLIHIPPDELARAVTEIVRVMAAGGCACLAVHTTQPPERASSAERIPGGGIRIDEMLSQPVDLDFYFYDVGILTELLKGAGLEVVWAQEREPYPAPVEVQSRRAYVLARKPSRRR